MDAVQLAQQMIAINSVSSYSNAPVAALMRSWLEQLGFEVEELEMTDPAGGPSGNGDEGGMANRPASLQRPDDPWPHIFWT